MNAKKVVGTILVVAGITGTLMLGDCLNINKGFQTAAMKIFPAAYKSVEVEEGFYKKPYELSMVIEKNDAGKIEEYLATKDRRYSIYQGTQGPLLGTIDDMANNLDSSQKEQMFQKFSDDEKNAIIGDYVKEKVKDTVEEGKNFLKDLYDKIKGYFEKP